MASDGRNFRMDSGGAVRHAAISAATLQPSLCSAVSPASHARGGGAPHSSSNNAPSTDRLHTATTFVFASAGAARLSASVCAASHRRCAVSARLVPSSSTSTSTSSQDASAAVEFAVDYLSPTALTRMLRQPLTLHERLQKLGTRLRRQHSKAPLLLPLLVIGSVLAITAFLFLILSGPITTAASSPAAEGQEAAAAGIFAHAEHSGDESLDSVPVTVRALSSLRQELSERVQLQDFEECILLRRMMALVGEDREAQADTGNDVAAYIAQLRLRAQDGTDKDDDDDDINAALAKHSSQSSTDSEQQLQAEVVLLRSKVQTLMAQLKKKLSDAGAEERSEDLTTADDELQRQPQQPLRREKPQPLSSRKRDAAAAADGGQQAKGKAGAGSRGSRTKALHSEDAEGAGKGGGGGWMAEGARREDAVEQDLDLDAKDADAAYGGPDAAYGEGTEDAVRPLTPDERRTGDEQAEGGGADADEADDAPRAMMRVAGIRPVTLEDEGSSEVRRLLLP